MGDGGMRYYLDCDTSPPTTSRSLYAPKTLDDVIKVATRLLNVGDREGQIGKVFSEKFYGYVIKYRGKEPYFEAASDEEAA
jgi:hypothetical protein